MNKLLLLVIVLLPLFGLSQQATENIDSLKQSFEKNRLKNFDLAMQIARQGYGISKKEADKAFFKEAIAQSFQKKSVLDSALHYHLDALSYYESVDDKKQQAVILNEIAKIHRKLSNADKALFYYDKAYKIYDSIDDQEGRAIILNESGVVYEQLGQFDEARQRFRRSLSIQEERKDSVGIGYALEFIGYSYLLQENMKESEQYLLQALAVREKGTDSFALCLNYHVLGDLYSKMGDIRQSNKYIRLSSRLSEQLKYPDILRYNFQILIDNAERSGNYKDALTYQKELMTLNDSLYNIEKVKNVAELSEKYETAEKEKEILEQQGRIAENELRIKSRNQWIFGLSALAVVIGAVGFLLYKQQQFRISQQQKETELKLAISKIENQNRLQEQRLAISRDLHDNIGSQLTFIISSIDTLKHFLGNQNEKLSAKLSNINQFTRETITELRDTIWAMNKDNISVADLQSRISNFMENAGRSMDAIHFHLEDTALQNHALQFDSRKGINIYRIIQEAVNNAIKHADASKITVVIADDQEELFFAITDDGKGFDPALQSQGNGQESMRQRAKELQAAFSVKSGSEGTTVQLNIPKTSGK